MQIPSDTSDLSKTISRISSWGIIYVFLLVGIYCSSQIAENRPELESIIQVFLPLALLVILTFSAIGIGWAILDRVDLSESSAFEYSLLALVTGYAVVANGVLILALAGKLSKEYLFIWITLLSIFSFKEAWSRLNQLPNWRNTRGALVRLEPLKKSILLIGLGIFIITFILTITPPYDYDSQLYHLEAPRIFLKNGGIFPLPDQWLTYFPLTIEMLFTLGLGFGSDVFAKLINLTYGCILVLATYSFGRRYLGSWGGWLSAAVMLGMPIFPIWSSWAYIDNGWAVYTFLSAYCVMIWGDTKKKQWLVAASILMGVGLGTKYLSFGAAAATGLLVLILSRKQGWKGFLTNGLFFGIPALAVASPWYLKNILWTGDPFYPMFTSPPVWLPEQKEIWMSFVKGFGVGDSWKDYLLLPVDLYRNHERFSTGMGSIEYPSFLFPLILLLPFTRVNRIVYQAAFLSLLQFIVWASGSQVHRYLLPIYPLLSFLTTYVILEISQIINRRRSGLLVGGGIALGMMTVTLLYGSLLINQLKPFKVILGTESRDVFLIRNVEDYAAIKFIQEELEKEERVLMLWDGRGYYCQNQCIPDIDHSQWTSIVKEAEKHTHSITKILRSRGATHLLLNYSDIDYILQHDPLQYHQEAYLYLRAEFIPQCTKEVYRDPMNSVFEVTCF